MRRCEQQGAEGIVLDLRGNGGGLLEEAVLTASIFLPEGEVVVSTQSRTQGSTVYKTVGGNLPPRPMVVLINRDTASAAEILAAALADDGGATVVGTRSFGKGVFQQVIDLSNGGALDLTIGEYFTADGITLAGKGIHPDVRALDDPDTGRRGPAARPRRARRLCRSGRSAGAGLSERRERPGRSSAAPTSPRSSAGAASPPPAAVRARPAGPARARRARRSTGAWPWSSSGPAGAG